MKTPGKKQVSKKEWDNALNTHPGLKPYDMGKDTKILKQHRTQLNADIVDFRAQETLARRKLSPVCGTTYSRNPYHYDDHGKAKDMQKLKLRELAVLVLNDLRLQMEQCSCDTLIKFLSKKNIRVYSLGVKVGSKKLAKYIEVASLHLLLRNGGVNVPPKEFIIMLHDLKVYRDGDFVNIVALEDYMKQSMCRTPSEVSTFKERVALQLCEDKAFWMIEVLDIHSLYSYGFVSLSPLISLKACKKKLSESLKTKFGEKSFQFFDFCKSKVSKFDEDGITLGAVATSILNHAKNANLDNQDVIIQSIAYRLKKIPFLLEDITNHSSGEIEYAHFISQLKYAGIQISRLSVETLLKTLEVPATLDGFCRKKFEASLEQYVQVLHYLLAPSVNARINSSHSLVFIRPNSPPSANKQGREKLYGPMNYASPKTTLFPLKSIKDGPSCSTSSNVPATTLAELTTTSVEFVQQLVRQLLKLRVSVKTVLQHHSDKDSVRIIRVREFMLGLRNVQFDTDPNDNTVQQRVVEFFRELGGVDQIRELDNYVLVSPLRRILDHAKFTLGSTQSNAGA